MSLLELQDISIQFPKKGKFLEGDKYIKVLRNINLTIDEGEIVVLVGESGCGKTTIGKIITGLLKPTSGHLIFNGKDIYKSALLQHKRWYSAKDIDPELLKGKSFFARKLIIKKYIKEQKKAEKEKQEEFSNSVQFVQQDSYAALNPARTIYQSLYAPIANKFHHPHPEEVDKKIDEVMTLVGLQPKEQFLQKYPHQLSGGQRQRVLMARAISLEPKLIVADEPVSMIDVSLRLSILELMKSLNEKLKIAFVYITHDLSTSRFIGEHGRICIMYLGEIVEEGKVEDVVKNPQHPYTQALFSAVPVPDPKLARKSKPLKLKSMDVGNLLERKDGCPFFARCIYAHPECENKKIAFHDSMGAKVKCDYLSEVGKWTNED
ncbi:MAG: ABC transporter ATP-binding protein [Bacilli bacterium]|jgi:peptide/nickel transport system ATP-binding protein|nr:ABC transporter ATP-binding protein [Bacilli bacterium]